MIPDLKDEPNTEAPSDEDQAEAMEQAQEEAAEERKEGGYQ
jgi:hypothetical protein